MKRLQRWAWTDHVYDTTVFLIKGTGDQAKAWIKKTFDEDYVGEWTGAKTLFVSHKRGTALVLWFPPWWRADDALYLSVLAHETQHGSVFTLRNRGVEQHDASDEAFCYHQAWLFRECYKRLTQ